MSQCLLYKSINLFSINTKVTIYYKTANYFRISSKWMNNNDTVHTGAINMTRLWKEKVLMYFGHIWYTFYLGVFMLIGYQSFQPVRVPSNSRTYRRIKSLRKKSVYDIATENMIYMIQSFWNYLLYNYCISISKLICLSAASIISFSSLVHYQLSNSQIP